MRNFRKLTLVKGGRQKVAKTQNLRTGCTVGDSGIYRVLHRQHRLPAEVTLIKDHSFPRCSKCSEPVYFELLRSAPEIISPSRFQVALYELPELEPQDESLAG
jgi:hypothetical protein